jgi:hypothetical protein
MYSFVNGGKPSRNVFVSANLPVCPASYSSYISVFSSNNVVSAFGSTSETKHREITGSEGKIEESRL